ncbi:hypothetical protein [Arthrobacter sp. CAN_A1]|uniref:hypothetical protein n=1 Tax=Arthrobacter sp. CAN_A1 TaxID=2787717 RepID=UPI0018C9D480
MSVVKGRAVAVVFVGLGLLALAVVPALAFPTLIALSLTVAFRLRTKHPAYSRAWICAGLTVGLGTAAIAAGAMIAPQPVITGLLVLAVLAYAATVVLVGHAWSRGSNAPRAAWISAGSLGLAVLLAVIFMASFGRGIALANDGEQSPAIDTLLLVSAIGAPVLLIAGLIAVPIARRQHPISTPAR